MNTPTYQPFQVQNNATQGGMMSADATSASFGGADAQVEEGIAKGLGDAAYYGGAIQADQQRQVNNDKVRMALSAYGQKMDEKVSGDFLQRHGESAINMMPEVTQFHEDLKQSTLDSLDNDYQKRVFSEMEADRRYSSLKTVAAHQAKQQQIYHQHSLLAENASALNNAVVNQDDPNELQKNEFTIRQNTLHLYEDDPEADNKASDAVSHMYETIAKTKAQTLSATQALSFLDQHKDKIQEVARDALQAKFEDKAISEAASSKSLIISSMPGMDEGKAQKLIDETIKNPKEAELTMASVKSRLAVNEKMKKDADQAQTEGAWKSFIQNPSQDIDPNLPHEEQLKMAEYRTKTAKEQSEGSQQTAYGKLLTLPTAQFMGENLFQHRAELSEPQFNFLTKLQEAQRKGGSKDSGEFNKALTQAKEAASKLPVFNITEKDSQDVAATKESQLHKYLADFSDEYQKATRGGKEIQWDTIGNIQDKLIAQNVLKKSHWFTKDEYNYQGGNGASPIQLQSNGTSQQTAPNEQPLSSQTPAQTDKVVEQTAPNPNRLVEPPSTSESLLRSKLGVSANMTITGDDLKQSAMQVVNDFKTSVGAVASLPGKAWHGVLDPIGGKIGESFANSVPTKSEMTYANDLHALMQSSGIDTTEADNAFKKMNGVSVADPNTPGGQSLSGSNTPRMYINEVNKLANNNAKALAKQLNLKRIRNSKDKASLSTGEMFLDYKGEIRLKD